MIFLGVHAGKIVTETATVALMSDSSETLPNVKIQWDLRTLQGC